MNQIVLFLIFGVTAVAYNNCENSDFIKFRSVQDIVFENTDAEGDFGIGGGGHECVPGQRLNVYLDPMGTESLTGRTTWGLL